MGGGQNPNKRKVAIGKILSNADPVSKLISLLFPKTQTSYLDLN